MEISAEFQPAYRYDKDHFDIYGTVEDEDGQYLGEYIFLCLPSHQEIFDNFCDLWIKEAQENPDFIWVRDLETTGLVAQNSQPILSCISWDNTKAVVVLVDNLDLTKYIELLRLVKISNQNNKFDNKFDYVHYGVAPKTDICTFNAVQLAYCGQLNRNDYNLGAIAKKLLDIKISKEVRTEFPMMLGTQHDGLTYYQSPDGVIYLQNKHIQYGARDAIITRRASEAVKAKLISRDLLKVWEKLEVPLIDHFTVEESKGMKVDNQVLDELCDEYEKEIEEKLAALKEKASKYVDLDILRNGPIPPIKYTKNGKPRKPKKREEFNFNSVNNLGKLFQALHIPTKDFTEESLEDCYIKMVGEDSDKAELVGLLKEYRGVKTEYSKGAQTFQRCAAESPSGDRVYYDLTVCLGETGRMAGRNPNLLAVADKSRRPFIPDHPDYKFLAQDFGQFEFRAIAGFSKEESLLIPFRKRKDMAPEMLALAKREGFLAIDQLVDFYEDTGCPNFISSEHHLLEEYIACDIHRVNAATIWKINPKDVDKGQRKASKTFGYALLYGQGISNIRAQLFGLGLRYTLAEVKDLISRFEDGAADMFSYIRNMEARVTSPGFIVTPLGRKKYFNLPPKYYSNYSSKLAQEKRKSVNAGQQSANADAIKLAEIYVREEVVPQFIVRSPYTRIPLPIHDELLNQVHANDIEEYMVLGEKYMVLAGEESIDHSCPIEVSSTISDYWKK